MSKMNVISIKSETADCLSDFLSEHDSVLKRKLVSEGYEPVDISEIMSAYKSIQGHLIRMLGDEGASFEVKIRS
jgi:hypothetical protein